MRYNEPKERSAELLRAALGRMGQHDAAFNPVTFAVWYEAMSGTNPRLERAIDEAVKTEPRLGDEAMLRLYREHVSEVGDEEMARLSADFQGVMTTVAESASRTGAEAGAFGRQLDGLSNALQLEQAAQLTPVLSETLAGLAGMLRSTDALQQQVASSRLEIERLRGDLSRARQDALLDPLTGILNRKGFDRRLDQLLQAARAGGPAPCLLMLDIDHFKNVNDTHGHVVGDRVIAAVGEVLRQGAGEGAHTAARYGGEEFAVLLPEGSAEQGAEVAEALRQRIKAMKLRKRNTQEVLLTVTVSAGVAVNLAGEDAAGLISRADAALYQSKQAGRDRVTLA